MPLRAVHWVCILVVVCAGCAGGATTLEATPTSAPAGANASEAVHAREGPVAEEPAAEVAASPRLEVAAPSDLAAAIAARLPTIELVPQMCGVSHTEVVGSHERLCLQDTATGLARATRRFVTSYDGLVTGARRGDEVVFAALDIGMATTRYSGHLWRWTLVDDRYVGLAELDDEAILFGPTRVDALDFGILIRTTADSATRSFTWLFADGELQRLREIEALGTTWVVDGHTYSTRRERQREVVSSVRLDGPRIVLDRITTYPRAWHLPLAVHFPAGQPRIISAFPRGERTELHVLELPGHDVRVITVDVERPIEARFEDGRFLLRTAAGWQSVDWMSGTLAPATVAEARGPFPLPHIRSVHAIVPVEDGVVLTYSDGAFRLGPTGTTSLVEVPGPTRSGCHCDGDDVLCGETRLAGGCTTTPELERIVGGDESSAPPTTWSAAGRFRIDRLEPDLTRITRTSDGTRLWVRVTDEGIFAQADDGAFEAPSALHDDAWSLRWGRSLLDAPVTPLATHRDAFYRPTVVADFFSDRPLPAADTTLP